MFILPLTNLHPLHFALNASASAMYTKSTGRVEREEKKKSHLHEDDEEEEEEDKKEKS